MLCFNLGISQTYYVSPNGADANNGSLTSPFKTINKARQVVGQTLSTITTQTDDITVKIMPGTYVITSSMNFTANDSGKNSKRVVYEAFDPNNKPIISGASSITGWTLYDSIKSTWKASIDNKYSRQVYVNGSKATRAKSDDNFNLYDTSVGYVNTCGNIDFTTWNFTKIKDLEVVSNLNWASTRVPISKFDCNQLIVDNTLWSNLRTQWDVKRVPCTRLENAYELISDENEYYIDRLSDAVNHTIYLKSTNMPTNVVIPTVQKFISANGLSNVVFKNLKFEYNLWNAPSNFIPSNIPNTFIYINVKDTNNGLRIEQGDVYTEYSESTGTINNRKIIPGSLSFNFCNMISIIGCEFKNIGSSAIELSTGCKNFNICTNVFNGISASGISIGSLSNFDDLINNGKDYFTSNPIGVNKVISGNVISNNLITNVGTDYYSSCPIFIHYASNTKIFNNTLSNFPWCGIHIGTVNFTNYIQSNDASNGNIISDSVRVFTGANSIHHNYIDCSSIILKDVGGIYNIGAQSLNTSPSRSNINDNYILNHPFYRGAIYLDQESNNFDVFNNLIDTNLFPTLNTIPPSINCLIDDGSVKSITYWSKSFNITISNNFYNSRYGIVNPITTTTIQNGCSIWPCSGNTTSNNTSFSTFNSDNTSIKSDSGVKTILNCN